jgi:hypothetical protein
MGTNKGFKRKRGWITNPGSQQYTQLEHAVSKMRGEFTSIDMMNFMRERWDTEGLAKSLPSPTTGEPVMQRRFSFRAYTISRFLQLHPMVETVDATASPVVYRRKTNE